MYTWLITGPIQDAAIEKVLNLLHGTAAMKMCLRKKDKQQQWGRKARWQTREKERIFFLLLSLSLSAVIAGDSWSFFYREGMCTKTGRSHYSSLAFKAKSLPWTMHEFISFSSLVGIQRGVMQMGDKHQNMIKVCFFPATSNSSLNGLCCLYKAFVPNFIGSNGFIAALCFKADNSNTSELSAGMKMCCFHSERSGWRTVNKSAAISRKSHKNKKMMQNL